MQPKRQQAYQAARVHCAWGYGLKRDALGAVLYLNEGVGNWREGTMKWQLGESVKRRPPIDDCMSIDACVLHTC
jgi:hypothetical protein